MDFINNTICRVITAVAAFAASCMAAGAQEPDTLMIPDGYELVDTVMTVQAPRLDTALVGKSIFSVLPSRAEGGAADVHVHQSQQIRNSLEMHIRTNPQRITEGYRVRIFFDNKQSARAKSEETEKAFAAAYPDIPVYRSYVNPYFKVTAGDYRTKSEAMQLLRRIVQEFPTAFVVKENINYPAVDRLHPTVTDTVRILRPIQGYAGSITL